MSGNTTKNKNPKIPLIIDCTLDVLRNHGEQGLSMRKVAAKAGMSLGNLQFYFKNKDELLKGMVDAYFEKCSVDFNSCLIKRDPKDKQEMIRFLIEYGMGYAHSDIGEVFRELWGMANRNEGIKKQLDEYYRMYVEEVARLLTPFASTQSAISRVVSLLVPYFDGHGMISYPLPADEQEMIEFLTNIVDSVLEEAYPIIDK